MPQVKVGNSELRYDTYGEGDPLVLAHGVGGNRVSWFRQVPHFSERYKVIVFDHRGFGLSTDCEGFGRDAFVNDLSCLLDHLGIEKAHLVGQSMGGGTCAAFTCTYPGRVASLTIADSLAGVQVQGPLAHRIATIRAANSKLSQVERVLGPTTRSADPAGTLLYLQLASFNSVTVETVRGQPPVWSPECLARSGVPVQFIVGEQDVLFPPDVVRDVQDRVPGSLFDLIPEAGHSAYFEQAGAFNRVLGEFLRRQRINAED